MPRAASLISREVLPFALSLLALAALLVDAVLHYFDQVRAGRACTDHAGLCRAGDGASGGDRTVLGLAVMPKPGTLFILVVLFGVLLLAIFRPEPMLAPGPVKPAHAAIADDCFACHLPFKGAAAERCITSHAPARIGLFTTRGKRLAGGKAAFHQQLITPDCLAYHTDHAGPARTGHSPVRFHHDLLKPAVRGQCATCHVGGNTRRYTCYGCHEHQPARVLAEHREEGVRGNIDNCARCHRSAEGEREGEGDDE